MHRRDFLKTLFGFTGAIAVVAIASPADALPLAPPTAPAAPTPAVATDKDIASAGAGAEKTHWRPYRHNHGLRVRRRRFWRRRRW